MDLSSPSENRATVRYPSILKKAQQIVVRSNEQWNDVTFAGLADSLPWADCHTMRNQATLEGPQRHVTSRDKQRDEVTFEKPSHTSSSIPDHIPSRDDLAHLRRALEAIQEKDKQRKRAAFVKSMGQSSSAETSKAARRKKTQVTIKKRGQQYNNNDHVPSWEPAEAFGSSISLEPSASSFAADPERGVITKSVSWGGTPSVVIDSDHYRSKEARGRTKTRDRSASPVHYSDTASTRSQSQESRFYHDDSPDWIASPHYEAYTSSGAASIRSTSSFVQPSSQRAGGPRVWRPCQTPENTSGYQYTSLLADEIRLLRVSPASSGDPLLCSLKIVPLVKLTTILHEFQALSYAWGNDPPSYPVSLSDLPQSGECLSTTASTKCYTYLVRENLYEALRHIRLADDYLWIWVDALCLNQDDEIEKGQQILKMPTIYSNAWNVIAWLGGDEGSPQDIKNAVGLVPKILNLKKLNAALQGETLSEDILRAWVAFGRLLQRPWFKRRWVIQEVACARKLCVRIADHILSWLDFADAVELYSDNLSRMRVLYRQSSLLRTDPVALDGIDCNQAVALMAFSRNIFRKSSDSVIVSKLMNLECLVLAASSFAVSDIRDVVYALLYLANDSYRPLVTRLKKPARLVFSSNYSTHPADIFEEFVRYSIASSGSLDILCRPWATWPSAAHTVHYEDRTIPSWIGVASSNRDGPDSRHIPPEGLLGPVGGHVYDASRGIAVQAETLRYKKDWEFHTPSFSSSPGDEGVIMMKRSPVPQIISNVLRVRGMILGKIETVSASTASEGLIKNDWLKTLGWQGALKKGVDDQLWRTLVANRNAESKVAPTWYRRACALALTKLDHAGNLDITVLTADPSQPATLVSYLTRVREATTNRRSFRCEISHAESGSMGAQTDAMVGFGPEHISSQDHVLVCILYGSSVPVILNKIEDSAWGTTHVKLVGACYVHGHMEGEIFSGMSKEEIRDRSKTFSIH